MYTLFCSISFKRLASEQLPAIVLAWLIAEIFYKFHSFTLECLAFLATWFVFDLAIQMSLRLIRRPIEETRPG
jgi:hypothetical protein